MICYQSWAEREPVGRNIYSVYNSDQFREHILTFGGIGVFDEKAEAQAINYTAPAEGFLSTFTHTEFAKGIRISNIEAADDLDGVMEDSPAELGKAAYATEETTLSNHFNNGFDSDFTSVDGKELFATDHVREDGGSYANELTTSADLSSSALEQALIDFRNFRTGGGRRLQIQPETLLVPPDQQFNAARILDSTHEPETDRNAVQPINDLGLSLQVWDYLTDTDAWFLLAGKSNHKLVLYERESFTTSDVFDFDTGDLKFKGTFRQSSGWGDPRGVFGSPGA
jgi:phage major head subunit gpT-like protein